MLPNLLQVLILAMSTSLSLPLGVAAAGTSLSTLHGDINSDKNLEARKSSVVLMTFYEPRCSSNGILESPLDERCEQLPPRTKGLIVQRMAGGCMSELCLGSFPHSFLLLFFCSSSRT